MTDIEKREIESTLTKLIELLKPQPLGVVMDCINWIVNYNSMGNDEVREIMLDVIQSSRRTTGICFADVVPDCCAQKCIKGK